MTRSVPEQLDLALGEFGGLAVRMSRLAARGAGWVNLRPIVEPQHQPDPPSPFAIFGGSAHKVPTGTWVAGKVESGGAAKGATVGLQHSSGPRVVARLRQLGLPLPAGWRVIQDHPRRGMVAVLPTAESSAATAEWAATVEWMVRAATAVSAVPITGRWSVELFGGSD